MTTQERLKLSLHKHNYLPQTYKSNVVSEKDAYKRKPLTSLHSDSVVVKSQDVSFLVKFLYKYAYMWERIGTALKFQYGELQNIKDSSPIASPQHHLNQLLDKWTQWPNCSHHEVPTVKRLCDALRSDALGLTAEANKLQEGRHSLLSAL